MDKLPQLTSARRIGVTWRRVNLQRLPSRLRGLLLPLVIGGCVIAVFGQTIGFDFLCWDDNQHIVENHLLRTPSWDVIAHFFTTPYFDLYIPLTYTLWSVVAWVTMWLRGSGAIDSASFHSLNISLHLLNTLLVYALSRRLFTSLRASAFAALLFALHPLQVEPVAWISGARDLLSTTFSLVALHQIIPLQTSRAWRHIAFFILSLLLALLAKPVAVTLPVVAAFFVIGYQPASEWRHHLLWLFICSLAVLPLVAFTFHLQDDPVSFIPPALWQRPFIAGDALVFYAGKLIFPYPLTADYGHSPLTVLASPLGYASLPALLLLLIVLLRWRRLNRTLLICVGISLAALAPGLGLVPFNFQRISTVADRYAYFAMVGPALALGAFASRWRGRSLHAGIAGVLVVLASVSFHEVGHWRNSNTLFSHTLTHNPRSITALNNLAIDTMSRGDFSVAEGYLRQALNIDPSAYQPLENLAVTLQSMGRTNEAITVHLRVLALMPGLPLAHVNLGELRQSQGKLDDALFHYQKAVELDPSHYLARNNLGALLCEKGQYPEARVQLEAATKLSMTPALAYFNLGQLLFKTGDEELAMAALNTALTSSSPPKAHEHKLESRIHNNLALIFFHRGSLDEAQKFATRALSEDAANPEIHYNAGLIERARGNRTGARAQLEQSLVLAPKLAEAWADLAIMDWEEGHNSQALDRLTYALSLSPQNVRLHCNFGSILRSLGYLDKAHEHFTMALGLDPVASCARDAAAGG